MKYTGSCHCGAVKYEIESEIKDVLSCNCSICMRRGQLLVFVPDSQFKLIQGKENLKDYQFGKKTIHHLFCSTCGVSGFSEGQTPDGAVMKAVNARCLENVDVEKFPVKKFDGKSL